MSDTPCSRQLGWQVSSCWRGRGIDADHLAFCSWHAVHHRRRFFDIDSAFGCSQLLVYPVRLRANSAGLRVVAVSAHDCRCTQRRTSRCGNVFDSIAVRRVICNLACLPDCCHQSDLRCFR
jgi:hypothetical protein